MNQDLHNQVRDLVAEALGVDAQRVVSGANFVADLGADSLRVIEILTRLEKNYKVRIDQANLARMVTLDAVEEVLDEALATA